MPPPEEAAKMSPSEMSEWRAEARKKRKALKQRKNRARKKKIFQDIESMLPKLSAEVAALKKDQGSGSDMASGAGCVKIQATEEDEKTSTCATGLKKDIEGVVEEVDVLKTSPDCTDNGKCHSYDRKDNTLGLDPSLIESQEIAGTPQGLAANNSFILSEKESAKKMDTTPAWISFNEMFLDITKTLGVDPSSIESLEMADIPQCCDHSSLVDKTRATDNSGDGDDNDHKSQYFRFDIIENIEAVDVRAANNAFDGLFHPVDTNDEDRSAISANVSVIDSLFVQDQLPL